MDWDNAQVFLAVARGGSFSAAAEQLQRSQPTISRQVRALEESLGTRLFLRHARGVRLSERAAALVVVAEEIEAAMLRFERRASGLQRQPRGVVRLAATEIVGVELIAPALAELYQSCPQIQVELVLQNTSSDLSRGEADVALRLFRPGSDGLVGRKLMDCPLGLYASRDYLERAGRPGELAEVLDHALIGFDPRGPMARALGTIDPRLGQAQTVLGTDSLCAQLNAARAGAGIFVMQRWIAARYPELERIDLRDYVIDAMPYWLVTHEDLRQAPHIDALWCWLVQTVEAIS